MFRNILTLSALLATGCRAVPSSENEEYIGHDLDEVVTETAANDTGEIDNDLDAPDSFGTPNEDTSDTGMATTDPCLFAVPTWDGDVTMKNEVTLAFNPQTPALLFSHIGTFAEIDISIVHEKCPGVTITNLQFAFVGSDVDGTGWYESIEENGIYAIDRSTGEMIGTSTEGVFYPTSEGHFAWYGSFQIDFPVQPEGQGPKRTIAIGTNASDSPAATDDYVIFTITTNSLWWSDGTTEAHAIHAALSTGELSIVE